MARQLQTSFTLVAFFATLFLVRKATGISVHRRRQAGNFTTFLNEACSVTLYPPLCYSSLQPYGHIFNTNKRKLTVVAISVSLTNATNTTGLVSNLREMTSGIELMALDDCVSMLTDGTGQMRDSLKALQKLSRRTREWQLNNVKNWMSAALTNEDTCMDGFQDLDGKVKAVVDEKVGGALQLTSIALALVNWFSGTFPP